jgi:hypothetical protein
LDTVRHPEVGLGLLLVVVLTATVIATAPDDIALVPLMNVDGIGFALVVADLYMERYLPRSLQL